MTDDIDDTDERNGTDDAATGTAGSAPRVWVELERGASGVGLTVYGDDGTGATALDEAFWTWAAFTGGELVDPPFSAARTDTVGETALSRLLTAESVHALVTEAGYTLEPTVGRPNDLVDAVRTDLADALPPAEEAEGDREGGADAAE